MHHAVPYGTNHSASSRRGENKDSTPHFKCSAKRILQLYHKNVVPVFFLYEYLAVHCVSAPDPGPSGQKGTRSRIRIRNIEYALRRYLLYLKE